MHPADPLNFHEFVRVVVDILTTNDIEYAVGGSLAVWVWGEARLTQDVDIVVHLTDAQIEPLSRALMQQHMAVPPDIMHDLIHDPAGDLAINAIDGFSGFKAELFPVRDRDDFRPLALQRRKWADIRPDYGEMYVLSPEDLILYKVQYYAISRQTKHIRDIGSILDRTEIDLPYMMGWLTRWNLVREWQTIQSSHQNRSAS
jgi:hypothetical protein